MVDFRTGCFFSNNKIVFRLFAPRRRKVELHLFSPIDDIIPMKKDKKGLWECSIDLSISDKILYKYRINGKDEFPDPCSNFQPEGVHGPSMFVDHDKFIFKYKKPEHKKNIFIMEIHIGTFTDKGTFHEAEKKLEHLKELGIDLIEIMPVAAFDGSRNWGYDGVYLFAPDRSYGDVKSMKRFIDRCHDLGIGVLLDVVYNHIGPSGNYLSKFAPYFTAKYHTPWGEAVNYDDNYSYGIREFVLQNVRYWFDNFNIDGLRLDAVHSIFDQSGEHIIKNITDISEKKGIVVAESDLNDSRLIDKEIKYGLGCDYQWTDDFHHALHCLLTGEKNFYYQDYTDRECLIKSYYHGYVFTGSYSAFRKRCYGNKTDDIPTNRFVVFNQNHDQIGNRKNGDRLISISDEDRALFAAAFTIMSPFSVMLFMGEEFGEDRPFNYFVDFKDKRLRKAVFSGRKKEFSHMIDGGKIPDPNTKEVFIESKLDWDKLKKYKGKRFFKLYKSLISLKKQHIDILGNRKLRKNNIENDLFISKAKGITIIFNLKDGKRDIKPDFSFNVLLSNNVSLSGQKENKKRISLDRYGFIVLEKRK